MTVEQQPSVSPPIWVVVVWWVLMILVGLAGFGLVIMLIAFGCDSGWQGCEDASVVSVGLYIGIAAVALVGTLIWAVLAKSTGIRILAGILMLVGPVLALVAAWTYYWWMASRAGAG